MASNDSGDMEGERPELDRLEDPRPAGAPAAPADAAESTDAPPVRPVDAPPPPAAAPRSDASGPLEPARAARDAAPPPPGMILVAGIMIGVSIIEIGFILGGTLMGRAGPWSLSNTWL